jgi:DNA-directed RNA polymerase specialized sigma24 family protein
MHEESNNPRRPYWDKLCEDFREILIAYARWLVNGNVADAEDLVQDTMVRVLVRSEDPDT